MDGRKREKTPDLNKKKTKAVKQEKRAVFPVTSQSLSFLCIPPFLSAAAPRWRTWRLTA